MGESWLRLYGKSTVQNEHMTVYTWPRSRFSHTDWISLVIKMFIITANKNNLICLPPFSLIRDFGKQNTRGNVSKISVNRTCYRHVGSKSTNHSPLSWRREGQKVTLVTVIGGFWSDLWITRKTDRNFGNVSAGVLFSKVAYQRKRW